MVYKNLYTLCFLYGITEKKGKKYQNATKQGFCHNQKTKVCFTWNTSFLMDDIPSVTSASSCYLIIPDKIIPSLAPI